MKTNRKIVCVLIGISLVTITLGYTFYNAPKSAEPADGQRRQSNTYLVTWASLDDTTQSLTGYASKNDEYTTTVSYLTSHLQEIRFHLSWTDDKATLWNRAGLDTLTLDVTSPDGTHFSQSGKSAPRTKQGTLELAIPISTTSPASYTVQSRTVAEAAQTLRAQNPATPSTNSSFFVRVSVKVGEIRPLKRLQDQGNSFELNVTPAFYTTFITENLENITDPLEVHIKAGPLSGYPPLSVSFDGNPKNDSRIVAYSWEFGPPTSPIVPAANMHNVHAAGLPLLLAIALVVLLGLQGAKPTLASIFTLGKTASTMETAFLFLFASILFALITQSRSIRTNAQYTSMEQSPTMVFLATGNYWAKLTVTDAEGRTASDEVYITALQYVYPDNDHDHHE